MMPPNQPRTWIGRAVFRGEHKLPCPLVSGAGVLARKSVRELGLAVSFLEIAFMQAFYPAKVPLQRLKQLLREHRYTVLVSLALPHDDLPIHQIHAFPPH